MINYLTHEQIDKQKWDECIHQSLNSMVYAYSWYLDIASPNWDALILNDYEAVFPITKNKKWSVSYLYQPLFTQQLGLFYKATTALDHLNKFIKSIPKKFKFIDINLNESNGNINDNFHPVKRKNYLLDLNKPYLKLFKNFSEQARRSIKKSQKNELHVAEISIQEIIDQYKNNRGIQTLNVSTNDYARLEKLAKAVEENRTLFSLGVKDSKNKLLASALFIFCRDRLIYHLGSSSAEGRDQRAMYFLFDHMIQKHSEQEVVLDFEGSEIPGVAEFFKGFGARKSVYYKLHINRLPWYIKWLKK